MGSGTLPSVCFWLPLHCDRLCSPPTRLPVSFSTLYTQRGGLNRFYDYTQEIVKFSSRRLPLDINSLKSVRDRAAWCDRAEKLTNQMRSWLAEAPARQIRYHWLASRIWQQWVQPQGILGGLLNILLAHSGVDNPADQIHRVVNDTSKVAKQFTDPGVPACR